MLIKISELEAITFLKYDDVYNKFTSDKKLSLKSKVA